MQRSTLWLAVRSRFELTRLAFLRGAPSWGVLAAFGSAALLASCGGDDRWDNCFNCGPSPTPTEISYGVASADLFGSGAADLVQITTTEPEQGPNASNLATYVPLTVGHYSGPTLTPDGNNPLYIATADLNGDGFFDVVTASADDGVLSVFLNDKLNPGTFNTPLTLPSQGASQVAIGDVNGDGLPDLVSADFNVSLFVQTSPGTFATPISLYSGGANWVAIGDLNGDGAPDVALTDNVGVKVLMHTGAASSTTFATPVAVFTQTLNQDLQGANIIAIGDVNGDGLNDLVITDPGATGGMSPTVNVLLQESTAHGSFATPVSYSIAVQDVPQSILLYDLQGSGHLDIIIGGTQTVTVLLHDPANAGKFLAATVYQANHANEIAIADVNGDGKPDIVVSNGVTFPTQNGVVTTHPGVLLQSATTPGTFGALQDLP
jgi:hypothetical protein